MLTNLLNPKVILLFLALLPNFVEAERTDVPLQLAFLGAMLILVNTIWQLLLAWTAERVRRWFAHPQVGRLVSAGTGAALLLMASLMLWSHVIAA